MMAVLTVPALAGCIVFISERFNPGEKALTFEEEVYVISKKARPLREFTVVSTDVA